MLHESNEKVKVQVHNARLSFEDVYHKDNLSPNLLENIKNADIILLPHENFKGFNNCFPEQTYKFYSFLKKEAVKHDLTVDIGASDEEYKELELHADIVNIAEVLIQWVLFPIVTGMIAAYLYDLVKQRKKKINACIKISVEKKGKTKTINFEGDIENFEKSMKSIKDNIFDE